MMSLAQRSGCFGAGAVSSIRVASRPPTATPFSALLFHGLSGRSVDAIPFGVRVKKQGIKRRLREVWGSIAAVLRRTNVDAARINDLIDKCMAKAQSKSCHCFGNALAMKPAVVLSAVRTPIATARKGSLVNTTAEEIALAVLKGAVARSGLSPEEIDDVIFAESQYGGGALARHAAVEAGMTGVSGMAINRHCAGSLTSSGVAAATIMSGMEKVIIAGGVQSSSTSPRMKYRVMGTEDEFVKNWSPPTHPDRADAPNRDMSITVGWNTAQAAGITREEMDRWALRSHQRAVAAIDAGHFADEIVPIKARKLDGSYGDFTTDEHPRRDSSYEKLSTLKPLHPEIEGFSITAGNSSGMNDAGSALVLADADFAASRGLSPLAKIRGWAAVGIDPKTTGMAVIDVIPKVLARAGAKLEDVKLWEINEAFASVPIAACKAFGLDEETVNVSGSGCSLGHPVGASGGRMIATLIRDLQRRGGGVGVATMCAGGGQAGRC